MDNTVLQLTEKNRAYGLLRDSGLSVKEAEQALGYKDRCGYKIERKLKKVRQLALTAPTRVNSAVRTITKFAKGKAVNGIEPTPGVVLASAKEITDRADPKVALSQSMSISLDISPIDLSAYRTPPESIAHDIDGGEGEEGLGGE